MSSPLDARIRSIAREEASTMFTTPEAAAPQDLNVDRVGELERRIAELTDRVAELEKAAAAPAPKRAPRAKTTETTE